MKKLIFSMVILLAATSITNAQQEEATATAKKKILANMCDCVSKADKSSIKSNKEIDALISECFTEESSFELLMDYYKQKKVDVSNDKALQQESKALGKEFSEKCDEILALAEKVKQQEKNKDAKPASGKNSTAKKN